MTKAEIRKKARELNKLAPFIKWLERQPPNRRVNYLRVNACIMTRYFGDHGIGNDSAFGYGGIKVESGPLAKIAVKDNVKTYGAALAMARSMLGGARTRPSRRSPSR